MKMLLLGVIGGFVGTILVLLLTGVIRFASVPPDLITHP